MAGMSPCFPAQIPAAGSHQLPAEKGCSTWGDLGHLSWGNDHKSAPGAGQVRGQICSTPAAERSWRQSSAKISAFSDLRHTLSCPGSLQGTWVWEGKAAGRCHRRTTARLLSREKALMRLSFPSAAPTSSLSLAPTQSSCCHPSSAWRSAANRVVFLLL